MRGGLVRDRRFIPSVHIEAAAADNDPVFHIQVIGVWFEKVSSLLENLAFDCS
jgi:hypothetical protein